MANHIRCYNVPNKVAGDCVLHKQGGFSSFLRETGFLMHLRTCVFYIFHQRKYIQYGEDRGDGAFAKRGPG